MSDLKVAIVYDRVNKWGGAERILLTLHRIFPSAPLYTSVYSPKKASWASVFKIEKSFLQKIPFARSNHEFFAPLMPLAFESFDFAEFDLVISVTSEAAKGIVTPPQTKHICICLTPTRYLYSGYNQYFSNPLSKFFFAPFVWYLKKWDLAAAARPDKFIAISKTVQKRIENIYKRDSIVIYPPIDSVFFKKNQKSKIKNQKSSYFLIVSRLVKYKKIDIAIKAANKLKVPLVIIGKGRREKYLKKIAGPTVKFENSLTEDELIKKYTNAKALIFPGEEDLGLTMIEAQASGTPVIAYKKGGATEIVKEGITGEFFNSQTTTSLAKAMEKFNSDKYNSKNCKNNAKRFNFEKFKDNLLELINK